ncbi:response regulator [Haliea sp. E1-2-M8]|uniref:response regulator n=1 Tax=Haliea sp. E1-2-M8 TaxID=3064706 RepID=UPI0027274488|nr:response regulator [Haliea sp. E1-2-M8]MDO8863108.1 response regulator [Haliea sp. E1-2-M8]
MNRTVLLIEDNEQNRYLATFLLERSGFTVASAVDGLSGINLAQTLMPDLILLDIQLPTMDGHAVARLLSSDATLHRIPIVAVTSHAMAGDRERCLEAGCNGYIEKPINPDTFIEQISAYFGVRSSGPGAA